MHAQALQLDLPEPQQRKRCAGVVALAHVLTAPRLPRARQAANLPVDAAPAPIQPELELPAPGRRVRSAASILAEHQARQEAEAAAELIIAPGPAICELDLAPGVPELANCEPVPPHEEYAGLYQEPRPDHRPPYWVDL